MTARTSEPPCFSVIDIAASRPDFVSAGLDDGSWDDEASSGFVRRGEIGGVTKARTTA